MSVCAGDINLFRKCVHLVDPKFPIKQLDDKVTRTLSIKAATGLLNQAIAQPMTREVRSEMVTTLLEHKAVMHEQTRLGMVCVLPNFVLFVFSLHNRVATSISTP